MEARYTRSVGRTHLRIVSALLMSVVLTVPVLGAVCGMLCEPSAAIRAHRSHVAAAHRATADAPTGAHHHGHHANSDVTAADQHHPFLPTTVSDAPQPSAEWSGRCCDRPTLTLAALPVVRHELQVDTAVVSTVSVVLGGTSVRLSDLRRDNARTPASPTQSNPVLRI
jgi:hypothetical protein